MDRTRLRCGARQELAKREPYGLSEPIPHSELRWRSADEEEGARNSDAQFVGTLIAIVILAMRA